jgi:hypothetical protein
MYIAASFFSHANAPERKEPRTMAPKLGSKRQQKLEQSRRTTKVWINSSFQIVSHFPPNTPRQRCSTKVVVGSVALLRQRALDDAFQRDTRDPPLSTLVQPTERSTAAIAGTSSGGTVWLDAQNRVPDVHARRQFNEKPP